MVAELTWAAQSWQLLPCRAAFWREADALVVADTHIGKDAAFRASGIPVPGACADATLLRLTNAIESTRARQLFILGDFFHARAGVTRDVKRTLDTWRTRHKSLQITLIRGNHDNHAGDPAECLEFRCVDEYVWKDAVCLAHHPPRNVPQLPTLCGHLHPAIVLFDRISSVRLPCFWFAPQVAVWPSFGDFTGMKAIRPRPGDRVFGIADEEILEVSGAFC